MDILIFPLLFTVNPSGFFWFVFVNMEQFFYPHKRLKDRL